MGGGVGVLPDEQPGSGTGQHRNDEHQMTVSELPCASTDYYFCLFVCLFVCWACLKKHYEVLHDSRM